MKNLRACIAKVLVACMIFNLMVPAMAVYAEDQKTTTTTATTTEPTEAEIAAEKDGQEKVKDAADQQKSGQAALDAANAAKAAQQNKALSDSSGTDLNGALNQSANDQQNLDKQGKGNISLGSILSIAGAVLSAVGAVLAAIPFTAAVGAAMVKAGAALTAIGSLLTSTGKSEVSGANTANTADTNFVNDSSKTVSQNTSTQTATTVDSSEIFNSSNASTENQSNSATSDQRGTSAPVGAE